MYISQCEAYELVEVNAYAISSAAVAQKEDATYELTN